MSAQEFIALVLGPNGVVVVFGVIIIYLYRENTALRQDAMNLLKSYQARDEEERKARLAEERKRDEERWRAEGPR